MHFLPDIGKSKLHKPDQFPNSCTEDYCCRRLRRADTLVGSVSAPGIFFDLCPTGDLLGGALSAVRAQCNYLDV